jgi:hypothetical protein
MLTVAEMMSKKKNVNESKELTYLVIEKVTRNSIGYPFTNKVYLDNLGKLTVGDCRYLKTQHHIIVDDENGYVHFDEAFAKKCQYEVDAVMVEIDKHFEAYQKRFIENVINEFKFKIDISNRKTELAGAREYIYNYFEDAGFRVDIDSNYILNITIPEAK